MTDMGNNMWKIKFKTFIYLDYTKIKIGNVNSSFTQCTYVYIFFDKPSLPW